MQCYFPAKQMRTSVDKRRIKEPCFFLKKNLDTITEVSPVIFPKL